MNTDEIRWWHTIDLGGGVLTKGRIPYQSQMWNAMIIPANLKGKSVLDIGAWDGFYSFLCESRGATRILAIDSELHWFKDDPDRPVKDEGFQFAKEALNSKVEYRTMDAFDIDKLDEKFDIILAYGVIYHLHSPYLAIKKMYDICNEKLLIESYVIQDVNLGDGGLAYFYYEGELMGDPSNWWGMTRKCVTKICKRAGFKKAESPYFDGHSRALIVAEK